MAFGKYERIVAASIESPMCCPRVACSMASHTQSPMQSIRQKF